MESATLAAWVAAVAAAAALLFAIWSAISSHRAARSSDSSARSAGEALALERDRRHDELTPRIRVEEGDYQDEGIFFTNDGPRDYTSVRFSVETPPHELPVRELEFRGMQAPVSLGRTPEIQLGPMTLGDRRFVSYQRADPMRGTTLRLRITCTTGQDTWSIHVEVEISPDVLDTVR